MKCCRRGDAARVVDCDHGCPETVGGADVSRRSSFPPCRPGFSLSTTFPTSRARPLGTGAREGRRMRMSRADGLYTAVQRQAINQMLKLAASDDKTKIVKAFQLAEKITPDQYKGSVRFVTDKIQDDHPALNIAKHVTSKLSPRCRDRFIECLLVNTLLRGSAKRSELVEKTGMLAPTTILMSPTMRCNLTCDGCYAAEYSPDQDLDRALLQKIVDEGNDMGVYLFTMLGGEPFMYDELLDFARANKDVFVGAREVEQLVVHEGLAAEHREQVDAHVVALVHDLLEEGSVEILIGRVLRRVAAVASEIAAHGGAHEDSRRREHARLLDQLAALCRTAKKCVDDKTFDETVAAARAELGRDVPGDVERRVVVLDLVGDESH